MSDIASVSLAASPEGAWVARRAGSRLSLHASSRLGDAITAELETADFDLAFAGPPDQLVAVMRGGPTAQVLLYNPPDLEIAARAEVDGKAELAAVSGPRLALITGEHRNLTLVRCAPRALIVQPTESGPLVESVVGLEDNKLLVCQPKKIEQWDAILRRALLRLNLQLPPPPRWIGAGKGFFWATRPAKDDLYVYRASDGRVFEHRVGAGVVAVASHLGSTQLVVATESGLVRVQAFAHTTTTLASRSAAALAMAVTADDTVLYGCDDGDTLWRMSLAEGAATERVTSATKSVVIDMGGKPAVSRLVKPARASQADGAGAWREGLVAWTAAALRREARPESLAKPEALDDPAVPFDAALSALGDRVSPTARRAFALLYGAWLHGRPMIAIGEMAAALGGSDDAWSEALGAGALAANGWVAVDAGMVALVPVVARFLDGALPRAVRTIGEPPARDMPRGVVIARDLDVDAAAERLGAIAVMLAGASLDDAVLEARLHDAALVVPVGAARARELAILAERGGDAIVLASSAPLPQRLASLPSWPAPPAPPS